MLLLKEKGEALLVGILLLTAVTIFSVVGLKTSNLEERIAANQKQQTEAMMAAESGASNPIAFAGDPAHWGAETQCLGSDNWIGPYPDDGAYTDMPSTDAKYRARLICETGALGVESEGVVQVDGNNLARRVVVVDVYSPGLKGLAPINFVGDPSGGHADYDVPNSNAFQVFGEGGPAIATNNPTDKALILSALLSAGREDNYHGGVASIAFPDPFSLADKITAFVAAAKLGAHYMGPEVGGIDFGSTANPRVTVIEGDLRMTGGGSGAGVLIVEGDLEWRGGVSFDGLVMVLGGDFDISGNGNGGVTGSVFVTNIETDPATGNPFFSNEAISIDGGGTAEYRYSSAALTMAWNALHPAARNLLKLDNQGAEQGEALVIGRWRERI